MTTRPVFIVNLCSDDLVQVKDVEFLWHPGLSINQKQKSIDSFHKAIINQLNVVPLEVSTKSKSPLGKSLSSMNLSIYIHEKPVCVEALYQSSKVFEDTSFQDMLFSSPIEIKKRIRIISKSKDLSRFQYINRTFPLEPKSLFYNWLYLNVLKENASIAAELLSSKYMAFTDIEYNPQKSFSCQAYSVALFVAMKHRNIDALISGKSPMFIQFLQDNLPKTKNTTLF